VPFQRQLKALDSRLRGNDGGPDYSDTHWLRLA